MGILISRIRPEIALAALLLWAQALVCPAGAAGATNSSDTTSVLADGQIIVKYRSDVDPAQRRNVRQAWTATLVDSLGLIQAELWLSAGADPKTTAALIAADPRVLYAEPNYLWQADRIPNDPEFAMQWGLHNIGQTNGSPDADIDAAEAWDRSTGEPIVIGIIDSGIDSAHVDLQANIWTNPLEIPNNGLDDDSNGYVDDVHGWDFVDFDNNPHDESVFPDESVLGHGTHVAGIVGAVGNNAVGIAGVHWNARLIPLRFLNRFGFGSTVAAIKALEYAVGAGARITCNSWGGAPYSQALYDAITASANAGMIFVAAAGNDRDNTDVTPHYPSSYPHDVIISVAATTHEDQIADETLWGTNFGLTTVDMGAPGVSIYSTIPDSDYGHLSGTSMAAPHVAGAVGMIWSAHPHLTPEQVKTKLMSTADPLPDLAGKTVSGGRLNLDRSLADFDVVAPAPLANVMVARAMGTRVVLTFTASGDDGGSGTAFRYLVRFANTPLDSTNWTDATPFATDQVPAASGKSDSIQVTGLEYGTTYYFAVRVEDEWFNESPLSNGVVATTAGAPVARLSHDSLQWQMVSGDSLVQEVVLSNLGPGEMFFEAGTDYAFNRVVGASAARSTLPETLDVMLVYADNGALGMKALLEGFDDVGRVDTWFAGLAGGTIPRLRDIMEYDVVIAWNNKIWADAFEIGALLADYIDSGGAVITAVDAWGSGLFASYGRYFQQDGYSPFRSTGDALFQVRTLGWFNPEHPVMSGVSDLAIGSYHNQVALTPGATVIARWNDGMPLVAAQPHTVAINIWPGDGYHWLGDFPQLVHNAIHYAAGHDFWLDVRPRAGEVPPGDSVVLQVAVTAANLVGGGYDGFLQMQTTDPLLATLELNAQLQVSGTARLEFATDPVEFEESYVGYPRSVPLLLLNTGTDSLHSGPVTFDLPHFSSPTEGFSVAPGEQDTLWVTFTPPATGEIWGTVQFGTNDPALPSVRRVLHAVTSLPPVATVTPGSVSADLFAGGRLSSVASLSNTGSGALRFRTVFRGSPPPSPRTDVVGYASFADEPTDRLDSVAILAWSRYADLSPDNEFVRVQEALAGYAESYKLDVTGTADPGELETLLFDRHIFLVLEQENAQSDLLAIGSAFAPVLSDFASRGGTVVFLQEWGNASGFMTATGMLAASVVDRGFGVPLRVALSGHALLQSVSDTIVGANLTAWYEIDSPDARAIVTDTTGRYAVVAEREVGAGRVILLGFDFYTYNADMAWLLANAVSLARQNFGWVSAEPSTGTIPASGQLDLALDLNAEGLPAGDYHAEVLFETNDPAVPRHSVFAHLTVTDAPHVQLDSDSLDFGIVFLDADVEMPLRIVNGGTLPLVVDSISNSGGPLTIDPTGFTLQPGEETQRTVHFSPQAAGPMTALLTIHSNDPDEALQLVVVTADVQAAPRLRLEADSGRFNVTVGGTAEEVVVVRNTGGSLLNWSLNIDYGPGDSVPMTLPWSAGPDLPEGRSQAGLVAGPGGDVYVLGGWGEGNAFTPSLLKYDTLLQQWTELAAMPTVDRGMATAADRSGRIYSFSVGSDSSYRYDPAIDVWSVITDPPVKRAWEATAVLGIDGRIYLFGGEHEGPEIPLDLVQIYHPDQDFWTVGAPMPTPRYGHAAVAGPGGRIYVMGGRADFHGEPLAVLEVYDPVRDTWTSGASMPTARNQFAATLGKDERIYALGGKTQYLHGTGPFLDVVEVYDPRSDQWEAGPLLPGVRGECEAVTSGGFIHVVGGTDSTYLADHLLLATPRWLTPATVAGVLAPGDTTYVQVAVNATGLRPGASPARLLFGSNDPVTPTVSYHMVADVQSASDLLVYSDTINFREVRLGDSGLASICISNRGDLVLSMDVSTSSPDVFTPAKVIWTVMPGADSMFGVTFRPSAAGDYAAMLNLQANDPDQPASEIVLVARALASPDVSVSPDSMTFSVTSDADSQVPLIITNSGSGDLIWRMDGVTAAPPGVQDVRRLGNGSQPASQPPLPWTDLRRLDSVRIAITGYRFTPAYDMIHQELAGRGAITRNMVRPFTAARLDSIDVLVLDDYATSLFKEDRAGIRSWLQSGGRLLLQNRGINSLEEVNDILAGSGIQQYGQSWASRGFADISAHPVSLGVDSIFATSFALFCQWQSPAMAVVQDEFGRGVAVVARVGSGRVAVTCAELMADYNINTADTRLFVHRLIDWLARGTTVAATPLAGFLPPGTSQEVTVQTAGRYVAEGQYTEHLTVTTNDPLRRKVDIPIRVEVTGQPRIRVVADTVDFGTSFIGYGTTVDLTVENTGTGTLSIQDIITPQAQFNVAQTTFDVPVFDEVTLPITIVPDAEGIATGSMTITSNAANHPEVVLPLRGAGLWPPQVEAPVDSLWATVYAGDSLQQAVTVGNVGRSDLTFILDILPLAASAPAVSGLRSVPRSFASAWPVPEPVSVEQGNPDRKGDVLATVARMALEYQGDFVRFGVTEFGEVFPFVYPDEVSQMWGSGYTVVYRADGLDQIKTIYFFNEQIVLDSLIQVRADSQEVVVRYFGHTDDGRLGLDRTMYFERDRKYVSVDTRLSNLTSETLEDVVFKSLCDWDLDGSFGNDNWNYDSLRNMAYGWDQRWAGLAARQQPEHMDLNGRNDYFSRQTRIDFPEGPVLSYDGMVLLHFELGDLAPGQDTHVQTVYAMGDSLTDLKRQVDRGLQRVKWLDADIQSARIPQDSSLVVNFFYDAAELVAGDYQATVRLASNDPARPELTWPVHLHVDGAPSIAVDFDSLQLDTVYVGYPVTHPLTISNRGSDSLRLESVTSEHASVTTDWSSATLAPGVDTVLWVTVAPVDTGVMQTRIVMTSDDSIRGELAVVIQGVAAWAPALRLPSDTLHLALGAGDSSSTFITIANDGQGVLRWAFPELQAPALVRSNHHAVPGAIPLVDYIRAEPASGLVGAGATMDATLVVSAVTLAPGDFVAGLLFAHNDPALDSVRVHLALSIFEIRRGDANADNRVNARDIVYLVNTLWKAGPDPVANAGDLNCDFSITVQDIMMLIDYIFKGAPAPDCTP